MTPHLEAGGDTGNNEEGGSLIFVSDASAEAERLTTALRSRGYPVIDVPLALLVSRVSVQRPSLILCDADAAAALETIQRVRETPAGNRIEVFFLGDPGRAVEEQASLLQQEASGVFVRPVDEFILLRKVEALIGAPSGANEFPSRLPPTHRAPVLVAATRRPYRYDAGKTDPTRGTSSVPSPSAGVVVAGATSPGVLGSAPPAPTVDGVLDSAPLSSRGASAGHPSVPRARELLQAQLSPALESLLASAEQRVRSTRTSSLPPSDRLSPEAELEAVLPADVLDALDEPLDFDDDDDDDSSIGTNNAGDVEAGSRSGTKTTGAGTGGGGTSDAVDEPPPNHSREKTAAPLHGHHEPAAVSPDSQSARSTEPPATPPRPSPHRVHERTERPGPEEPPSSRRAGGLGNTTAHGKTTDAPPSLIPGSDRAASLSTVPPAARLLTEQAPAAAKAEDAGAELRREAKKLDIPASLGVGDAVRALARAVRARYTGALAFEDVSGIRRVLLRDGDFVTAASGADGESLIAFLTQRGDLPADAAQRLGRKLPQFGRHAGAALIAQGHLRQDDLWPVLRAHAEWLLGRIALLVSGAASVEAGVPARLQAEPAVFGGATGAEVLVEIVRRAVTPEQALLRLNGPSTVLQKGENPALLAECAIKDNEAEIVRSISEDAVSDVLHRAGHKDFAAVLYALVELSVLAVATAEKRVSRERQERRATETDHLDQAALRARILARKALSEEGDYFSLLGVSRNATSYDIRRAYHSLRDEYDPGRILNAETVSLREDVELILEVLAEAFDILEDDLRRERYRRALDASP